MTTPTAKRRRPASRKRWLLAGATALFVLLLPLGCAMIGPQFEPAIDTPEMRTHALASRFVSCPEGRLHYVVSGRPLPPTARVLFVHGSPGTLAGQAQPNRLL